MEGEKKFPENLKQHLYDIAFPEVSERERMQVQINMLEYKVKYLETIMEALIRKVEEPIGQVDYGY